MAHFPNEAVWEGIEGILAVWKHTDRRGGEAVGTVATIDRTGAHPSRTSRRLYWGRNVT